MLRVGMGCAFGASSRKGCRLFTNLTEDELNPSGGEMQCEACRLGLPHEAAFLPGKGSKRARVTAAQGYSVDAVRNRIQVDMGAHVARCMLQAWQDDRGDAAEQRVLMRRAQRTASKRRVAARASKRVTRSSTRATSKRRQGE